MEKIYNAIHDYVNGKCTLETVEKLIQDADNMCYNWDDYRSSYAYFSSILRSETPNIKKEVFEIISLLYKYGLKMDFSFLNGILTEYNFLPFFAKELKEYYDLDEILDNGYLDLSNKVKLIDAFISNEKDKDKFVKMFRTVFYSDNLTRKEKIEFIKVFTNYDNNILFDHILLD